MFGASLALLYGASMLYHGSRRPHWRAIYKMLDHCAIFALIAGTYTPFGLLMPPTHEWKLLVIVWGLAALGIGVKLLAFLTQRSNVYERFAFIFYLILGWLPIFWVGREVLDALTPMGFALLVAGGVSFSVGVIFYLWRHFPYGHAVWHLFVVGGATFHYFSIYLYVV